MLFLVIVCYRRRQCNSRLCILFAYDSSYSYMIRFDRFGAQNLTNLRPIRCYRQQTGGWYLGTSRNCVYSHGTGQQVSSPSMNENLSCCPEARECAGVTHSYRRIGACFLLLVESCLGVIRFSYQVKILACEEQGSAKMTSSPCFEGGWSALFCWRWQGNWNGSVWRQHFESRCS